MDIVFVSNYFNHHQKELCDALELICKSFLFIETGENVQKNYQVKLDEKYVISYAKNKRETCERIQGADVVIFGDCQHELIELRMNENKLSFLYSERFLKKGTWRRWIPSTRKKIFDRIVRYKGKNMYVLCASAYLPLDLSLMGFSKEKCFKWGYFPDEVEYTQAELNRRNYNDRVRLLWAGRFLKWKHPEMALQVANKLKSDGIKFDLNYIGGGEQYQSIQCKANEMGLNDCVHFLGSLSPEQVRDQMLSTDIFFATSDFHEGWGAVINEAMNSGCAVVASHAMGSVPYLIKDNENGLIYHSGKVDELYEKVKYLLDNPSEQKRLGKASYQTITGEWNAEVATERLINLSKHLLAGEKYPDLYQTGPCSRVGIIKDDWF